MALGINGESVLCIKIAVAVWTGSDAGSMQSTQHNPAKYSSDDVLRGEEQEGSFELFFPFESRHVAR